MPDASVTAASLQAEIDARHRAMEVEKQRFIDALGALLPEAYLLRARSAIGAQPAEAGALGASGMQRLRSAVDECGAAAPGLAAALLDSDELWSHQSEEILESASTGDPRLLYEAFVGAALRRLRRTVSEALDPLDTLLESHGLATGEGFRDLPWSTDMKDAIGRYSTLHHQLYGHYPQGLAGQLRTLGTQSDHTDALALWDGRPASAGAARDSGGAASP